MPKARPARSRWLLLPALGWHSVESGCNRKFPEGSGSQHSAQALHQLSSGLGPFFGWRCPPPPCKLGTGFLCSRELSRASLLQDSPTWIFNSSAGDQFPLFSDEGKLEMGDPGGCPCSPHPLQVSGQLPRVFLQWWFSCSVVFDSVCYPMDCNLPDSSVRDFPGKIAGVGCHSLLQGIFSTQGWNPGLLPCRRILYQLSHQGVLWSLC